MAAASYPEDLLYHPEHDWARIEGDTATLGITWYAQDALGEVVFFDPPHVGASVTAGEAYTEIESVKAVSSLYSPVSGEVVAGNADLGGQPELINSDPYGQGWIMRLRPDDKTQFAAMMDAKSYEAALAAETH